MSARYRPILVPWNRISNSTSLSRRTGVPQEDRDSVLVDRLEEPEPELRMNGVERSDDDVRYVSVKER
jgi:hypothetical protein